MNISFLSMKSLFAFLLLSQIIAAAADIVAQPLLSQIRTRTSTTGNVINLANLDSQLAHQARDGGPPLKWNEGTPKNAAIRQEGLARLPTSERASLAEVRNSPQQGGQQKAAGGGKTLGKIKTETDEFFVECSSCCKKTTPGNCWKCSKKMQTSVRHPDCETGSNLGREQAPVKCFFLHCHNILKEQSSSCGCNY